MFFLGVCSQGFPCSAIGQGHMAHGFVRHVSFFLHCPHLMFLCKYVWNHDFAKPLVELFNWTLPPNSLKCQVVLPLPSLNGHIDFEEHHL